MALDHWARDGIAPPASRYPRLADETLVPQAQLDFPALPGVRRVGPSAANFLLVEFADAAAALARARAAHLLVRDTRHYLAGSLRITIGTPEENGALLEAWS